MGGIERKKNLNKFSAMKINNSPWGICNISVSLSFFNLFWGKKKKNNTSISSVYCTFLTINQNLFDLQVLFWYQNKGIFKLYNYILSNTP